MNLKYSKTYWRNN